MTKVWYEAMAVVWKSPTLTQRYGALHRARSRQVIKAAVQRQFIANGYQNASADDATAMAVLISAVRSGLSLDKLLGLDEGHQAAVDLLGRLFEAVLDLGEPDARPLFDKPNKAKSSAPTDSKRSSRSKATTTRRGPSAANRSEGMAN